MKHMRWLIVVAALVPIFAATASAQQAPAPMTSRDLKYDPANPFVAQPIGIPRSYALVIGVAEYPNLSAEAQLQYSERDAEDIYATLLSREGGNFQEVKRLVGRQATLANIRRELEQWLPSVTKPEDRVLVYFAGHGFVSNGNAYLAPYDFDPKRIESTGYPMDRLGEVFGAKIRGKWKVLLTDACHSGAITPAAAQTVNARLSKLEPSIFSLTASRDREVSYEGAAFGGGHGVFTYYVKRGLEGDADESGDGVVNADELADYVRRNVREATLNAPRGVQNPTSDRGSFDPQMLLAYNPSRIHAAAPPPPKEGTLVFEVNMDNVEVFVDGEPAGVANKDTPLVLPGLKPGVRTIQGVRQGYEPDGPREQMVYPGQRTTVTLRISIPARRKKAAVDLFDRGLDAYQKGFESNYKKAVDSFQQALAIEPKYSQAALYLGRTQNALFEEAAAQQSFRRAIEIDPAYLEARTSLGGMLLDIGDVDEALRQLTYVVQRDRSNATAQYLLAQAYRLKEQYPESIAAARIAIKLVPSNAEAHFWLAESLRMMGEYDAAKSDYQAYLRLSDFDTGLSGQLNFWVKGFLIGKGRKSRASQQDIWKDLRSLAFFGLCDCEYRLARLETAIGYCQRSLTYYRDDPFTHYLLGLCYGKLVEKTGDLANLPAARQHFESMLALNSDLVESGYARKNLAAINSILAR